MRAFGALENVPTRAYTYVCLDSLVRAWPGSARTTSGACSTRHADDADDATRHAEGFRGGHGSNSCQPFAFL